MSEAVLSAIHTSTKVSGLTHSFYKYPARFSPEFVTALVTHFSDPGALIYDPFMGGGTTAVEALSRGRKFLGTDISSLAYFISRTKTTLLTRGERRHVEAWFQSQNIKPTAPIPHSNERWDRYTKHVPAHLRRQIQHLLNRNEEVERGAASEFIRAAILKTAQWALACRSSWPSQAEFRFRLAVNSCEMLAALDEFGEAVTTAFGSRQTYSKSKRIFNIPAEEIDIRHLPKPGRKVDLVITSPPYIGVHVLYHRWQIHGRRETPAPFWIAGKPDGHGGSYYTFADRRSKKTDRYFDTLYRSLISTARLLKESGYFFQLVSFADVKNQLPIYLETMEMAGFTEANISDDLKSRIKRRVPNQRWYAAQRDTNGSNNELFLCHQLKVRR